VQLGVDGQVDQRRKAAKMLERGRGQMAEGRGQRRLGHDVALNAGVGVAVKLEVHGLAATPARRGLGRTQA
jgi:hypothetical protein